MFNPSEKSAIGIFDSGVGGLTVAKEVMCQSPEERIVYFGDTARVPYGSKSPDTIIHYSRQIIRFLESQDVKAIVIACNTASACALSTVASEFSIPVIGVIKPGALAASIATRSGRIGVIGTEATINSGVYTEYIKKLEPNATVTGKACPLFVPLVEEGWTEDEITAEVAKRYLLPLLDTGIDTLILGCTHYPLLHNVIKKITGDCVTLVNPAYETAKSLRELLKEENLINPEPVSGEKYSFFVSDTAAKFFSFANTIIPYDIKRIQKINIEEY